jgi:glycosyltransferase involved in cell wall biosynthesis
MEKLSVVIITFNEEKNIERCLKSVRDIADEIIVLDSFSTDRTQEICEQYNATFLQHAFDGHIQQKNRVITHANYDLVLSLDADEAPDEALLQNIQKVKENRTADAYYFNRLTNYCGKWVKHSGWYPDRKLRLWDKYKGQWGGDNPHDKFEMQEGASEEHLKGDLLHYSYYTREDHIKQIHKFSDIASKAAYAKGKRANAMTPYFRGAWKFVRNYLMKLGILDGVTGWNVCRLTAWETYLKYNKLRKLG